MRREREFSNVFTLMNAQIAGCGKSFFLQVFRNYLEAKAKKSKLHENFMKVAAPTGTAAFNVNGGVQIKSICTHLCTVILLILLFHHCRDPAFIVSVAHKHESKVSFSFKYVLYCFPSTMQWWFFSPLHPFADPQHQTWWVTNSLDYKELLRALKLS